MSVCRVIIHSGKYGSTLDSCVCLHAGLFVNVLFHIFFPVMSASSVEPLFLKLTNTVSLMACSCQKVLTVDQLMWPHVT
jgi:hypothetical protein